MSQSHFQSVISKSTALAFLLVTIVAVFPAQAGEIVTPATLDALWDDPTDPTDDANAFVITQSGRFRFDQFTCSAVPPGEPTPDPEDIFVTLLTETSNTVSLLFQIIDGGLIFAPDLWDLHIGFRATVVDPLYHMTGQTLTITSHTEGDSYLIMTEEIRDADMDGVAGLTVYNNIPVYGTKESDYADFEPRQTQVYISKDLLVKGGTVDGGGMVYVSDFQQTFHFEPIPEPSGMALLILGCLGLGTIGWYSHRKAC
ncbi:MAG: hypothetical protein JW829_01555 [Pirellulales bacterium]|nr:hypothetical protein [Pirellulales bacterium]